MTQPLQFEIRAATGADSSEMARLHTQGWQQGYRGLLPDSYLDALDEQTSARKWAQRLADPKGLEVRIACRPDGRGLGFCSIWRCFDPDATDAWEIWDAWVDAEVRGQGVGRRLLTACLKLAPANVDVVVWVLAANIRGRRFYQRAGAVDDGLLRRNRRRRPEDPVITDVRMRWRRAPRLPAAEQV